MKKILICSFVLITSYFVNGMENTTADLDKLLEKLNGKLLCIKNDEVMIGIPIEKQGNFSLENNQLIVKDLAFNMLASCNPHQSYITFSDPLNQQPILDQYLETTCNEFYIPLNDKNKICFLPNKSGEFLKSTAIQNNGTKDCTFSISFQKIPNFMLSSLSFVVKPKKDSYINYVNSFKNGSKFRLVIDAHVQLLKLVPAEGYDFTQNSNTFFLRKQPSIAIVFKK